MLSYEWGQQQSVLLIKSELQRAGYQTWMDVDRMSGSTLEAMAKAVEGSAVVLVCISKRYKESQVRALAGGGKWLVPLLHVRALGANPALPVKPALPGVF